MTSHRLCLIHPADPRTDVTGLVESRVHAVLAAMPADFSVLFVGTDHVGDLPIGAVTPVEVAGRRVDFLPVARRGAAAFAAAMVRHLPAIRAAARAEVSSISVHECTWMPIARLVGRPIVLVVHRDPRSGAVAGRVSLTASLRESVALRLADRVVGCDAGFVDRCRATHPGVAAKTELLALPSGDDTGAVPLFGDDSRIARLWERHRRLFDALSFHRNRPAAA